MLYPYEGGVVRKYRPALFEGPFGWSWVQLTDLIETTFCPPHYFWENFSAFASKLVHTKGKLKIAPAWWNRVTHESPLDGRSPCCTDPDIMVPAGFANCVLRCQRLDISHVRALEHDWSTHEHTDKKYRPWGGCPNHPLVTDCNLVLGRHICIVGFTGDKSHARQVWLDPPRDWDRINFIPNHPDNQHLGRRESRREIDLAFFPA